MYAATAFFMRNARDIWGSGDLDLDAGECTDQKSRGHGHAQQISPSLCVAELHRCQSCNKET
jgi:hypothetical protein